MTEDRSVPRCVNLDTEPYARRPWALRLAMNLSIDRPRHAVDSAALMGRWEGSSRSLTTRYADVPQCIRADWPCTHEHTCVREVGRTADALSRTGRTHVVVVASRPRPVGANTCAVASRLPQ